MDKKKSFLVVILAAILAFVAVFFVFKLTKSSQLEQEQQVEVLEDQKLEPEEVTDALPSKESDKEFVKEVKPVVNSEPVRKIAEPKAESPVIKPIKVEEANLKPVVNNEMDPGIVKEVDTNEIVITREFKSQSPAKYSFQGYGVLEKSSD